MSAIWNPVRLHDNDIATGHGTATGDDRYFYAIGVNCEHAACDVRGNRINAGNKRGTSADLIYNLGVQARDAEPIVRNNVIIVQGPGERLFGLRLFARESPHVHVMPVQHNTFLIGSGVSAEIANWEAPLTIENNLCVSPQGFSGVNGLLLANSGNACANSNCPSGGSNNLNLSAAAVGFVDSAQGDLRLRPASEGFSTALRFEAPLLSDVADDLAHTRRTCPSPSVCVSRGAYESD